ncbi:Retrovirus-related Pol polyprotein from transposon [Nosema granulosis]|uniref:Retrovirus-related Pol polyprotein from transposon n=1 Tax=Nosema granulosis TaxID=83296 RepID=A0A9P6GXE5_9MICR|nr:Retrovirus-related Pol polyprotein from transposon [Nosema granulosis]
MVMTVGVKRETEPRLESERKEIILRNHVECGHGGIEPTYVMVLRNHSWKGMYKEIVDAVKTCDVCLRHSSWARNLKKQGIKLGGPFDKVGIDIVGPLPRTYNGVRFIVVATDFITRWSEADPLKSKSAKLVAEFIVSKIFTQHGPPNELLSDQGCEFLNQTVKTICSIMNSKKTFTTAYNPKCNGTAERVNQTLIGKLAVVCQLRHRINSIKLIYVFKMLLIILYDTY